MMVPMWRTLLLLWLSLAALAEESPPGLVSKDSETDLVAEASQSGAQAQKRDAGLSNSYGEPLPPDAYGPPLDLSNIIPDIQLPAPIYGVPENQNIFQEPPPGAYGPPSPVVFPSQSYDGPPPPLKPKPVYGPPKLKPVYGPPKPVYGPPKPIYGPPKPVYGPPKKTYGPPKLSLAKPTYGVPFKPPKVTFPKPVYGPPKPIYGVPKPVYGPQKVTYGTPISIPNPPEFSHIFQNVGAGASVDLGLNLPAPIYGTPLTSLPLDLKPHFPIPTDTYGPPGHALGPIGPDQIVVHDDNIGHYGPPQPDPNPRPPHPGIPAPPTPPHVLYDGWKPIPGVSKPLEQQHVQILDEYGPPPPLPEVLNLENTGHFSNAQITTGYSNVHQDALANIDLNAIVGGDSNHIDQSKTVFEAHYTESNPHSDLGIIQSSIPTNFDQIDSYGAPPLDSLSNGPYPPSVRQQGAKGFSHFHHHKHANLPIPYGTFSGGGHSIHTGGPSPKHPIKFRESVPEGLIQQIGHTVHHKDTHGIDHLKQGPAYLPPPIRETKDINSQTGNFAVSIEPTSLYSLPHSGNPVNFQAPSNLYGSPIDSYSVPLLTVGDHTASSSSTNAVTATLDGTILANLSNLEAAAILKHCPYHEAILKAAKSGEKIPSDLASKYVASLSSLGSTLAKSHPVDQFTASQTQVETVLPNTIKSEKNENTSVQKGKSIDIGKSNYNQISEQIYQTSQRIKNLSEEANKLQQKLTSGPKNYYQYAKTQDFKQIDSLNQEAQLQQNYFIQEVPSEAQSQFTKEIKTDTKGPSDQNASKGLEEYLLSNNLGSKETYSLQIQSSDGASSVSHDRLLPSGLLQSILRAVEQPLEKVEKVQKTEKIQKVEKIDRQELEGLQLPSGYEPVDHSKEKSKDCQVDRGDDIAVFFGSDSSPQ